MGHSTCKEISCHHVLYRAPGPVSLARAATTRVALSSTNLMSLRRVFGVPQGSAEGGGGVDQRLAIRSWWYVDAEGENPPGCARSRSAPL